MSTKDEEKIVLEVVVKRKYRMYLVPVKGECIVDGQPLHCGGNPVKMKVGGSLVMGGSKFIFKTRDSPHIKKKERRLPYLPQEFLSATEETSDSSSLSLYGEDEGRRKLIQSINKDMRKLKHSTLEQLELLTPVSVFVVMLFVFSCCLL